MIICHIERKKKTRKLFLFIAKLIGTGLILIDGKKRTSDLNISMEVVRKKEQRHYSHNNPFFLLCNQREMGRICLLFLVLSFLTRLSCCCACFFRRRRDEGKIIWFITFLFFSLFFSVLTIRRRLLLPPPSTTRWSNQRSLYE